MSPQGTIWRRFRRWLRPQPRFGGSASYWQARYASGGGSGLGSTGKLAEYKARFLNAFVAEHRIESVLELGCGDGRQLALASYPRYLGLDVSPSAIALCRERFRLDPSREFRLLSEDDGVQADLALSLDVIFHLVEDDVYEAYMKRLFEAGRRFVIVYSSNTNENPRNSPPHVRHRRFSEWVSRERPDFRLVQYLPNPHSHRTEGDVGSFSDFYVYSREAEAS